MRLNHPRPTCKAILNATKLVQLVDYDIILMPNLLTQATKMFSDSIYHPCLTKKDSSVTELDAECKSFSTEFFIPTMEANNIQVHYLLRTHLPV